MAHNYLIQIDQQNSFSKIIEAAKRKDTEVLANLVVVFDHDLQFLRIDGRIKSQNLTRDEQFPLVLSCNGDLAKLLIWYAYQKTGHGGSQLILQYLRTKYWITNARKIIKPIVKRCHICFKLRLQTSEQLMASLPIERTTPRRPFSKIGVDYAGYEEGAWYPKLSPITAEFSLVRTIICEK